MQYLNSLHRVVRQFPNFDLILLQAGADVHVDDPLGGVLDSGQISLELTPPATAPVTAGLVLSAQALSNLQTAARSSRSPR